MAKNFLLRFSKNFMKHQTHTEQSEANGLHLDCLKLVRITSWHSNSESLESNIFEVISLIHIFFTKLLNISMVHNWVDHSIICLTLHPHPCITAKLNVSVLQSRAYWLISHMDLKVHDHVDFHREDHIFWDFRCDSAGEYLFFTVSISPCHSRKL